MGEWNSNRLNADVSWVIPDRSFETVPYTADADEQKYMVNDLKIELRWLFGSFIPVWFSYDYISVPHAFHIGV